MIQLTINNSYSQISGLTAEQHSSLRRVLSYTVNPQAAYFSGNPNTTRYLIDKKGHFPTGLLYLTLRWIAEKLVPYEMIDKRSRPTNDGSVVFTLHRLYKPYPEQLVAAGEAFAWGRGIISMATGTGKSMVIAEIINALQVPTLVVVPSLELKRQLTETLTEAFGSMRHLQVENVDALDPKRPLQAVGCVILDEYHHAAAKTYRDLNKHAWKDVYHRYGLTATPFRTQDNERLLLESVLSQVIYRLDYREASTKGYICPVECYFYDLPKRSVDGYTWAQVYNELVVNNVTRNDLIAQLMNTLHKQGKSTLCLVKEIAHGEKLAALTGAGFANGQDESCQELIRGFNQGKLTSLIGTTGVLGEGVDSRPAEYVIIAGLGKSRGAFMQQCGRGVRRYPGKESAKVVLFRDPSHKFTLNHFNAQKKTLIDEYGVIPVKLN